MDSKKSDIIYYFSGSGNSLAVAKALAAKLNNAIIVPMASEPPKTELGGNGVRVGFIFPVYYGKLPRRVDYFLRNIKINPETYLFATATMGGPFGGSALRVLKETLLKKGIAISYGKTIYMVGNYIINYNPSDPAAADKKTAKARIKTAAVIDDILQLKRNTIRAIKFTANNLYNDVASLDKQFYADSKCIGCGLCEKICPVQNIKLESGKPVWQGRCEHCVACIHWCLAAAIQYGEKTLSRRRYHHPDVSSSEINQCGDFPVADD